MFERLAIFAKRTHIIVGRTEEKMLSCHCDGWKAGGCDGENYICVVAESYFVLLMGLFCVGEKRKGN